MYLGKNILLGSGSPRRRELLAMCDIDFSVVPIKNVDESYPAELEPLEVAEYLSRRKAEAYLPQIGENDLLITADTVVIIDNEILGKPADRNEAIAMLRHLSGRTHQVVTGVTLSDRHGSESFSEVTQVEFAPLEDEQIAYYVDSYKPFDKAGAYGIQEWIGLVGIKRIDGCFYNVMGLPTSGMGRALTNFVGRLKTGN